MHVVKNAMDFSFSFSSGETRAQRDWDCERKSKKRQWIISPAGPMSAWNIFLNYYDIFSKLAIIPEERGRTGKERNGKEWRSSKPHLKRRKMSPSFEFSHYALSTDFGTFKKKIGKSKNVKSLEAWGTCIAFLLCDLAEKLLYPSLL